MVPRENDKLPKAFTEPYEDDESEYVPEFNAMLEEYYSIRDWDPQSGIPSREKLSSLKLDWVVGDLEGLGQL